jgi:hypothetical protein
MKRLVALAQQLSENPRMKPNDGNPDFDDFPDEQPSNEPTRPSQPHTDEELTRQAVREHGKLLGALTARIDALEGRIGRLERLIASTRNRLRRAVGYLRQKLAQFGVKETDRK